MALHILQFRAWLRAKGCGEPHDLIFGIFAQHDHIRDAEPLLRQGPGLVEHHRLQLARPLTG